MFEKAKEYLTQIITKIQTGLGNMPKPVKWMGLAYFIVVMAVLVLFLGLFCYEYTKGTTHSKDLLPFINIIIGSTFIGFMTFIIGLCIDANDNGIPDSFEKEKRLR